MMTRPWSAGTGTGLAAAAAIGVLCLLGIVVVQEALERVT